MVTRMNFKSGDSVLASHAELLNQKKSKVVTFISHEPLVRGMRDNVSYTTSVK